MTTKQRRARARRNETVAAQAQAATEALAAAEAAAWESHNVVCYGGPLRRDFMARMSDGLSWAEAYDEATFAELMADAQAADAEDGLLRVAAIRDLRSCPVDRLRAWGARVSVNPDKGGRETCAQTAVRLRRVWKRWYASRTPAPPTTSTIVERLDEVVGHMERGYVRSVRRPRYVGAIRGSDWSSTPAGTSAVTFRSYCVRRDGQVYLVVLADGHTGWRSHQMDVERVEVWSGECIADSNLQEWVEANAIDL